jgi:Tfp pilus assembly protein PilN
VRAINLLPRDDVRRGRPQKSQWIVLIPVVLAVLLAAVLSAMFLSASGTVKDKQAELATLQSELAAIPTPDASRVKTQTALAADKQARVTALSGALSRRVAWDRVFRELSLVLPERRLAGDDRGEGAGAVVVGGRAAGRGRRRDRRRDRVHASTDSRTRIRRSRGC